MLASLACARCFGEFLWDAAFGSNFGEQLWEATLRHCSSLTNNCFEERQFWGIALDSNFGKQLSATTLGSFGEQLFGAAFDTTLGSGFGEQLSEAGLGSSFLGSRSSFEEQLCTAALKNRSFVEQLWGLALERNFGEQL